MATIINNPPSQAPAPAEGGGGVVGILVGVVLVAVIGFLFFAYGLPSMQGNQSMNEKESNPTINVPDTVDVNIKK